MTATGTMDPNVIIVPVAPTYAAPQPPNIISIYQASGIVYASVIQASTTGSLAPTSMNLYRALNGGAYTLIGSASVDGFSVRTIVTDPTPVVGEPAVYAATVVDSGGNESAKGGTYNFQAFATAPSMAPATAISQAALGPQPILGSDIYLDETTRMAQVGTNGDILTVNGVALLGQDLRIRVLTETGQLALDPDFGLLPFIGESQGAPVTEAQIVRSDVLSALLAEPRVYSILALSIGQLSAYGWGIQYTVIAIDQQDAANQNRVWPYYLATAA